MQLAQYSVPIIGVYDSMSCCCQLILPWPDRTHLQYESQALARTTRKEICIYAAGFAPVALRRSVLFCSSALVIQHTRAEEGRRQSVITVCASNALLFVSDNMPHGAYTSNQVIKCSALSNLDSTPCWFSRPSRKDLEYEGEGGVNIVYH